MGRLNVKRVVGGPTNPLSWEEWPRSCIMKSKNNSFYPKRKSSPPKLDKRFKAPFLHFNPPIINDIHPSTSYQPHHQVNNGLSDSSLLLSLPCYVGLDMMEKLQVEYQQQRHHQQEHQPYQSQEGPSSNGNDKSECPRCLKRMEVPRNMKRHVESHDGNGRLHPCSMCDKSFKQTSHAKAHLSVHGDGVSGSAGDMMACPVCFTEFKHGRNFKRHMLIHEVCMLMYNMYNMFV